MTSFTVTQYGRELDSYYYKWDEDTLTFSSNEAEIDVDFDNSNDITFNVADSVKIKCGSYCVINATNDCTFVTGSDCTFDTGDGCKFNTGTNCVFHISSNCTIKTGKFSLIYNRLNFDVIKIGREPRKVKTGPSINQKDYKFLKPKEILKRKKLTLSVTESQLRQINEIMNLKSN